MHLLCYVSFESYLPNGGQVFFGGEGVAASGNSPVEALTIIME
jgi:hypothetical protein